MARRTIGREIRPSIVNAYGFRRLRSPNYVFPGNAQNPLATLVNDQFLKPAGDFVANRDATIWTTASYTQGTNGINFDGVGNVQGLYIAGIPTVSAFTSPLTWNPNKGYAFRWKNTFFGNFQNGATILAFGVNFEYAGVLANCITVQRVCGIDATAENIQLFIAGVNTDTFTDSTALNTPKQIDVNVSSYTGGNRTVTVKLGGVTVITRNTNFAPVGGKAIRLTWQAGNDTTPGTVNIQTGGVTLAGYKT